MNAGILPSLLVAAALALLQPGTAAIALYVFATVLVASLTLPPQLGEWVFLGCWSSVLLSAGCVHLRRAPPHTVLAAYAGLWSGAVITLDGSRLDLLASLLVLLFLHPLARLGMARAPLVVKMAASWLVAVACLSALLQLLPTTPGYVPDHLE